MTDRIFIDSNIWCYLFIQDENDKYGISEKFISDNADNSIFVITYQVIDDKFAQQIQYLGFEYER